MRLQESCYICVSVSVSVSVCLSVCLYVCVSFVVKLYMYDYDSGFVLLGANYHVLLLLCTFHC